MRSLEINLAALECVRELGARVVERHAEALADFLRIVAKTTPPPTQPPTTTATPPVPSTGPLEASRRVRRRCARFAPTRASPRGTLSMSRRGSETGAGAAKWRDGPIGSSASSSATAQGSWRRRRRKETDRSPRETMRISMRARTRTRTRKWTRGARTMRLERASAVPPVCSERPPRGRARTRERDDVGV